MSSSPDTRARLTLADVPAMATAVALGAGAWSVIEDAFITFRYARNWAHGHGVRFNVGPDAPVEGFSNFLWLAVAAAVEAVGASPEVVVPALSLACAAVLVWQVRAIAEVQLRASPFAAHAAAFCVALFAPVVYWSTTGLEPMPQALLMLLAGSGLAFADRNRAAWATGFAALGLALIRTEGIAWVPVMAILGAVVRHREDRPIAGPIGRVLAVVAVGFGLFYAWKVPYYGAWVANTAVAKVGFGPIVFWRGVSYVSTFLLVFLWPLLLPLGLWHHRDRAETRMVWLGAMVVAVPAWSIVVGGDYMPFFRFLVPAAPWMGLALALTFDAVHERGGAVPRAVTVALVAALSLGPRFNVLVTPQSVLRPLDYSTPVTSSARDDVVFRRGLFLVPGAVRFLEIEAQALSRFVRPGETMVAAAIGLNGYRNPDVRFLDLCGLVNRKVARRDVEVTPDMRPGHEKCLGPKFFLDQQPDVLIFATAYGRDGVQGMADKVDRWRKKYPTQRYAPDLVVMKAPVPGGWFFGYGLRRAKTPDQAKRAWTAFEAKLDTLLADAAEGIAPETESSPRDRWEARQGTPATE